MYILNNSILVVNGKEISFKEDIKNIVEFEDKIIIQTWNKSTGNIKYQPINNVYALNNKADILWNIKDIVREDGIYTSIYIDEFNRLVATEFIGRRYIIDINDQQLIDNKAYK